MSETREEQYLRAIESSGDIPPYPITREEFFLAKACGEDVETPPPITRKEQYLSNIGGGVTPESLTVTENGTYTAPQGTAYTPVTVAVPEPSGNIALTPSLSEQTDIDVSDKATASVDAITKELLAQLDADFVAGNIKKDVDIIGLVGTLEGGLSGWSGGQFLNTSQATSRTKIVDFPTEPSCFFFFYDRPQAGLHIAGILPNGSYFTKCKFFWRNTSSSYPTKDFITEAASGQTSGQLSWENGSVYYNADSSAKLLVGNYTWLAK